jgi:hypothetical protein
LAAPKTETRLESAEPDDVPQDTERTGIVFKAV